MKTEPFSSSVSHPPVNKVSKHEHLTQTQKVSLKKKKILLFSFFWTSGRMEGCLLESAQLLVDKTCTQI